MATPTVLVSVVFFGVLTFSYGAGSLKQLGVDDRCPKTYRPVFLSHETDCSLYYTCLKGKAVILKCPQDLHFNPKRRTCDFPNKAGCEKALAYTSSIVQCPSEEGRDVVLLPDPTDCSSYFTCVNGQPFRRECQGGLHFNPSARACDYPANAGCDKNTVTEEPQDEGAGVEGEERSQDCPAHNGASPVLLKHPTDCSSFYLCDNGKPYLKQCQHGLHFNPSIDACDYPESARCDPDFERKDENNVPDGQESRDDFAGSCPTVRSDETVLVPHPRECSKFYMCHRGVPHLKTCPAGLHFNRNTGMCDYPQNAHCEDVYLMFSKGTPSPFCPSVSGRIPIFYGHPTNCSVYYLCSNGLSYEFICPARLHFNLRKKVCDYEEDAKCPAAEH